MKLKQIYKDMGYQTFIALVVDFINSKTIKGCTFYGWYESCRDWHTNKDESIDSIFFIATPNPEPDPAESGDYLTPYEKFNVTKIEVMSDKQFEGGFFLADQCLKPYYIGQTKKDVLDEISFIIKEWKKSEHLIDAILDQFCIRPDATIDKVFLSDDDKELIMTLYYSDSGFEKECKLQSADNPELVKAVYNALII